MISNNGADIFRYWGEAHVSGSADSGTCSSGMERLFAFPLLSVKEKTDLERADLDRYKNKERERETEISESENEIDPRPRIFSSPFFVLLLDFSLRFFHSFVSILSRINFSSDRSIDRSFSGCRRRIYIYIYIERYGMEIRFEWRANPARNYLEAGARCN